MDQRMSNIRAATEQMEKEKEQVSALAEEGISNDSTLRYSIGINGKPHDLDKWLDDHSNDPAVKVS